MIQTVMLAVPRPTDDHRNGRGAEANGPDWQLLVGNMTAICNRDVWTKRTTRRGQARVRLSIGQSIAKRTHLAGGLGVAFEYESEFTVLRAEARGRYKRYIDGWVGKICFGIKQRVVQCLVQSPRYPHSAMLTWNSPGGRHLEIGSLNRLQCSRCCSAI